MWCTMPSLLGGLSEKFMDKKELLLEQLRALGTADWAVVAIAALSSPEVHVAESSGTALGVSARHLLRVYALRKAHLARFGRTEVGLDHFLQSLSRLEPDSLVSGDSFLGRAQTVMSFYNASNELIGCITLP